jgi:hypothetical protein
MTMRLPILLMALLVVSRAGAADEHVSWTALFNGRDLTG